MVNIHCKYITHCFPCCCFKCLSFPFYDVLFLNFLGMSKVQTPSPHASKKHDKRCDSCQAYVSELDPHPVCPKCVPRECSRELPCSHCASLSLDAWKKWECQQASRRSSSSTKGPKGDSAKGGGGGEKIWEGSGCLGIRLFVLPGGNGLHDGQSPGTPHGVPSPRSQNRRVPSLRRGCSRWRDLSRRPTC